MPPHIKLERELIGLGHRVIGVDEVGRGCIAGPVVSAAVILPEEILAAKTPGKIWKQIDDSKQVTPEKRRELSAFIRENARVAISWSMPDEIDRINILHASMLSMRKALTELSLHADAVLVDGHLSPYDKIFMARLPEPNPFKTIKTVVTGDAISLSIAAASIVAKVYRDEWMGRFDSEHPGYGFAKHKGYLTPEHISALKKLGPCAIHRHSFAPIADKGGDQMALFGEE